MLGLHLVANRLRRSAQRRIRRSCRRHRRRARSHRRGRARRDDRPCPERCPRSTSRRRWTRPRRRAAKRRDRCRDRPRGGSGARRRCSLSGRCASPAPVTVINGSSRDTGPSRPDVARGLDIRLETPVAAIRYSEEAVTVVTETGDDRRRSLHLHRSGQPARGGRAVIRPAASRSPSRRALPASGWDASRR